MRVRVSEEDLKIIGEIAEKQGCTIDAGERPTKQLIIRISEEDRKALKVLAAEQGTSVQEIILSLIRGFRDGRHRYENGQWFFDAEGSTREKAGGGRGEGVSSAPGGRCGDGFKRKRF